MLLGASSIRMPVVIGVAAVAAIAVSLALVGSGSSGTSRAEGGAPDCGAGTLGTARLSAYEWREAEWRGQRAAGELVRAASDVCLDRVYVDVTAAGAADEVGTDELADDVSELVQIAAARDLEVGVVAGDPWWPTDEGRGDATRLLAFVDGLVEDGVVISSLHLDVEPWGLDEWATSKEELLDGYVRFVEWVERSRSSLGSSIPVTYLIPYWFDGSNGEVSAIEIDGRSQVPFDHLVSVMGDGGSVSVMAYRNRAHGEGGIVDLVGHEIRQQQVPVLVGVETTRIDPPTATFAGFTPEEFRRALRSVTDATATEEVVVNDVDGLLRLTDQAGSSAD